MTLVILAAGMGSRYGGLKQLDPITENGEFIIDFSVYDAIKAGFDKVIFIIKKENYELFKSTIGDRVSPFIKVEYAFQELDNLPEGFSVPEGRTKPWGTTHALLCCNGMLNENFAVINADDFYGREAFVEIYDFLSKTSGTAYGMAGYTLKNTLTENGTVSRGVCVTDKNGFLVDIDERTKICEKDGKVKFFEGDTWHEVDGNSNVSLNFWAFTPDIFDYLSESFNEFLKKEGDQLKSECYIPVTIKEALAKGKATVKVVPTDSLWYGVTYIEDKPYVVEKINAMITSGKYPNGLWK